MFRDTSVDWGVGLDGVVCPVVNSFCGTWDTFDWRLATVRHSRLMMAVHGQHLPQVGLLFHQHHPRNCSCCLSFTWFPLSFLWIYHVLHHSLRFFAWPLFSIYVFLGWGPAKFLNILVHQTRIVHIAIGLQDMLNIGWFLYICMCTFISSRWRRSRWFCFWQRCWMGLLWWWFLFWGDFVG